MDFNSNGNGKLQVPLRGAGSRAVVIGAGIAGLAAAAALSEAFDQVVVLERDHLSETPARRYGTPHDGHAHGLLVGGLRAFEELLPGIGDAVADLGAVRLRIGQDVREERPNGCIMPQRDFNLYGYTMSRPLLEFAIRKRVLQCGNVAIRQNAHVVRVMQNPDDGRVIGVGYQADADWHISTIDADLVIDASAQGRVTLETLKCNDIPWPIETKVEMGMSYTSAILRLPLGRSPDWRLNLTLPNIPQSTRRAVMLGIEDDRWILTVAGLRDDRPPNEWPALLAHLKTLPTTTIHDAVKDAEVVGKLTRWNLRASVWRRFDQTESMPQGLIPIGDAICRFNPAYGQGMSVAAKEAVLLRNLLREHGMASDGLDGLATVFHKQAADIILTPWIMAATPDLAMPQTIGERPDDLEQKLQFLGALSRLAVHDEAVHRLMVEVWHLLKPFSVYDDPALVSRVQAEMADGDSGSRMAVTST